MAKATKATTVEMNQEQTIEVEQPVIDIVQEEIKNEPVEEVNPIIPIVIKKVEEPIVENLSFEDRIVKFLESRNGGFVKVNDFLKSLYPLVKFNEPALYLNQGESKKLRVLLSAMQSNGKLQILNNQHLKLGAFHYPDPTTMKTEYYNLSNVSIEAKCL